MGFLDLGLSDIFGAGMDMLGDRMQYSYDKRLMNEQRKQNQRVEKWSALNLPSLKRQGYESAGYNPLLAYSSNFGSAQGVSIPNFTSKLGSSSVKNMMEANTGREEMENNKTYQEAVVKNQKAEVKNKEAQTKVLEAQAEETRLNNKEHRELTSWRDKADVVLRALQTKLNYIGSSAGQTGLLLLFLAFLLVQRIAIILILLMPWQRLICSLASMARVYLTNSTRISSLRLVLEL